MARRKIQTMSFAYLIEQLGGDQFSALIGITVGLLFGSGMILARGCASRLLVLSATGNMRGLSRDFCRFYAYKTA